MSGDALRHLLLTGFKRGRVRITSGLRDTTAWAPLRAGYRALSPLWRNTLTRAALMPLRRRLYGANPRGYWQQEGRSYMRDEAFLRGAGSLSERQGEFLAAELSAIGAASVLEVGCGYGRLLKELQPRLSIAPCGVDFSESQLTMARQYLGDVRVPLLLADVTRGLPLRDGAFDVVYTQGSLMHVPSSLAPAYRREVARVARRYIVHTEDRQSTEITFVHDNETHYSQLGYRLVKKMPYPFNLPGQRMTFEVFGREPSI